MIAMSWPEYPAEARKRPSVPIVLEIHVTATGEVDAVKVENESGCPACERAAIASAWKLRFLPATRDGHPFAMWMRFPVTFRRR
jgi:TonB family protein